MVDTFKLCKKNALYMFTQNLQVVRPSAEYSFFISIIWGLTFLYV